MGILRHRETTGSSAPAEPTEQFGIAVIKGQDAIVIIDAKSLTELNYNINIYTSIANGNELKVIPYDQSAYEQIKCDPMLIQDKLGKLFS